MTDLEITKLCAEAMGYTVLDDFTDINPSVARMCCKECECYWPLHDDAQAMALVKKFGLQVVRYNDPCEPETMPLGMCAVIPNSHYKYPSLDDPNFNHSPKYWYGTVNRAICECVVSWPIKMRQAHSSPG